MFERSRDDDRCEPSLDFKLSKNCHFTLSAAKSLKGTDSLTLARLEDEIVTHILLDLEKITI